MHVFAPEKASTCRSKSAKGEWIEKVCDNVIACNSLKGKISQMGVMEDFESRPHKTVSFFVERDKEVQEWNEQKLPKMLPGYNVEAGCQAEKKRRKRRTVERKIRDEIAQEVVGGHQKEGKRA